MSEKITLNQWTYRYVKFISHEFCHVLVIEIGNCRRLVRTPYSLPQFKLCLLLTCSWNQVTESCCHSSPGNPPHWSTIMMWLSLSKSLLFRWHSSQFPLLQTLYVLCVFHNFIDAVKYVNDSSFVLALSTSYCLKDWTDYIIPLCPFTHM